MIHPSVMASPKPAFDLLRDLVTLTKDAKTVSREQYYRTLGDLASKLTTVAITISDACTDILEEAGRISSRET